MALDAAAKAVPTVTLERAILAARLGVTLPRCGWRPHQHRGSVRKYEPESTPVEPLDSATEAAIARVQHLVDTIASEPMPRLRIPFIPWSHDTEGRLHLDFASDGVRPAERAVTRTNELEPDRAAILWQHIVNEIASDFARVDRQGLSSGRVFLGPKDRLIFWPRYLNALLLHVPVALGRIFDLFSVLARAGVKLDVKSAYRALELAPADAAYHAAIIDGVWVTFTHLSFGMAQSPAMFTRAIAVTVERYRDSLPATSAALAQYVDDSGLSALTPATAVVAGEHLLTALLRDGWWPSIAKTFMHPASRLYYTGFVADFENRAVRLAKSKTDKVMDLLQTVTRPTDDAIRSAALTNPSPAVPPAAQRHQPPGAVPAAPTAPDPGGDGTQRYHHPPSVTDSAEALPPRATAGVRLTAPFQPPSTPDSAAASPPRACGAGGNPTLLPAPPSGPTSAAASPPRACGAGGNPTLLPAPPSGPTSAAASPPRACGAGGSAPHPPPPGTPDSAAATPRSRGTGDGEQPNRPPPNTIFDPQWRLPPGFLPDQDPLPAPTSLRLPTPSGSRIDITPDEFYAISKITGYLSWFQVCLPFLAPWRAALHDLQTSGRWTPLSAEAFDQLFAILPVAHLWRRRIDPVPGPTLHVVSDGSATGWGAVVFLPGRAPVRLSGRFSETDMAQSSTYREAVAAVRAVQAAVDAGLRFADVAVTVDSQSLVGSASGHARSAVVASALIPLATWAAQGLVVGFSWWSRASEGHQQPDALSEAAGARPWPLRPEVLRDTFIATGGWDVDIASDHDSTSAPSYATFNPDLSSERGRAAVLDAVLDPNTTTGWRGTLQSVTVHPDEAAFANPLRSALAPLAARIRPDGSFPFRLILVAPTSPAGFWGQHLTRLQRAASVRIPLPPDATTPPRPGATGDPRPLSAYVLGPAPPARASPRPLTPQIRALLDARHRSGPSPPAGPPPTVGPTAPHHCQPPGGAAQRRPPPAHPVRHRPRRQPPPPSRDHAAYRSSFGTPANTALARSGHPPGDRPDGKTHGAGAFLTPPPRRNPPETRAPPQPVAGRAARVPAPPAAAPRPTATFRARRPHPSPPAPTAHAFLTPPHRRARGAPASAAVATAPPARTRAAVASGAPAGTASALPAATRSAPPTAPSARAFVTPSPPERRHHSAAAGARAGAAAAAAPVTSHAAASPATAPGRSHVASRKRAAGAGAGPTRSPAPDPKRQRTQATTSAAAATAPDRSNPPPPLRTAPTTFRQWFLVLRDFLQGRGGGAVDADVPRQLQGDLAAARSTVRLKAVAGSSRRGRATRRLAVLAASVRVLDEPCTPAALNALATAYALRRLRRPPPFGWLPANAATTESDLSSVAALARLAGLGPVAPVCGSDAAAYLRARGAGQRREHSDAFPIHLSDILAAEPPHDPSRSPTPQWWTWAAITVLSYMCLRPGILQHLRPAMFVGYDRGWVFCWRWVSKTSACDILDPELRSATIRVMAARGPALDRIFAAAAKHRPGQTMFPAAAISDEALGRFVRERVHDVPPSFTIRTYGVRVAADLEAMELGVPGDLIDALFWWKRSSQSTRLYYGGLSIARMFAFSEHRVRLRFIHTHPGRYDARITGSAPPPTWAAIRGDGLPKLPPKFHTDLQAAWAVDASALRDTKERYVRQNASTTEWDAVNLQGDQEEPAEADEVIPPCSDGDEQSDAPSDVSIDCSSCHTHLSRHRAGMFCDSKGCRYVKCRKCHRSPRVGFFCPQHKPPL